MENLVLIDGNSVLYRAFYATPYLAASNGTPTNAVYGFVNMLLKIISDVKPEHILVAFDRQEPTYRHKMFDGYKAGRKPMPDELVPQVDLIKKTLDAMGISRYEHAGLEADDIIGSAAKKFDVSTAVITGDKDSFQLVDETTSVYFTKKGISELEIYTNENFKEKTGINPVQIIDLKAIMGDKSDNIPGIFGIGEKGALALVQSYGSVENLYEHLSDLKGKTLEKVENGKQSAFMSKTLATINVNAEIPFTLDDLSFEYPFSGETRKYFLSLEFKNFAKKNIFKTDDAETVASSNDEKFSVTEKKQTSETNKSDKNEKVDEKQGKKTAETEHSNDQVVFSGAIAFTKAEAKSIVDIKDCTSIAKILDSLKGKRAAFYLSEDVYFSDGETEYRIETKKDLIGDGLSFDEALYCVKPLFSGENDCKLIVFDKKALKHTLEEFNVKIDDKVVCDDVMLQKYVVDYTQKELSATECVERAGLNAKTPAFSLYSLFNDYSAALKEQNLEKLYSETELPLCDVLFEMERYGFKVDKEAMKESSEVYKKRIAAISAEIKSLAGIDFNLNSPKQLGDVLFEKLGLKHGKKTKSGYSTSAEVLESLEDEHPIIPLILRYRMLQKLYSTYIEGLWQIADGKGVIHTVFNQAVTSTGRLSSKEPNLQNIPVRDDEGKEIRKFFIPSTQGGVLVSADYSQIELRLLAHYSGCKPLISAFCANQDIHALTASQVFGVGIKEVTEAERRSAKAVNFGIIYGISDYGLSKNLKIPVKTAGEYIKRYFEEYPKVEEYMKANVEFAQKNGYICTAFGRKRFIPEINSSNYNMRSFGKRAAMNMPLQGTAADIIKIAMINVFNRLKREVPLAKLILQVHDELIVDCKKEDESAVAKILREEMEGAVKLSVPLTVSVSSGINWFNAK